MRSVQKLLQWYDFSAEGVLYQIRLQVPMGTVIYLDIQIYGIFSRSRQMRYRYIDDSEPPLLVACVKDCIRVFVHKYRYSKNDRI